MSQARPLPPGAERRRQLRQQQRQERLRNAWRMLVLLALAGGLGYGLLRQGWVLRGPDQVEVQGSRQVTAADVIKAANLRFPQPLLTLDPRRLGSDLSAALPVEDVQVSRLMAPPRLRVELLDRQPVARAERRNSSGLELGYVDRLGNWMSARQGQGLRTSASDQLLVQGWQPRHRTALTQVLLHSKELAGDLRRIRFDPSGSLWVESASLGNVRLGPSDSQLERRLQVLSHLVTVLPAQLKGKRPHTIDLTDPNQPELALTGGAPPPSAVQSNP
ncbi:MAG: FtsQ-type POTRA domain-containing protein [Cyanobacteria bacterium M_surface_10_m2_119]|nr:FtsQ-type POTRA domain-containing protein [Cyanobacteria bacterium M_surface_10_m2_119]